MPRLLVVHHTTSPTLQTLLEAVRAGATDPEVAGVEVVAEAVGTAGRLGGMKAQCSCRRTCPQKFRIGTL